jgi:stearoyl-CoA desaturase (Delta-9 desaturase)
LGGWSGFVVCYCIPTVFLLHSMALLDAVNHLVGSRRYDTPDDSRNSFWMSVVGSGEGWHNNHHHYQASARQGFFWWELDMTYYVLKLMSWVGVVKDLKQPPARILRPGSDSEPDRELVAA